MKVQFYASGYGTEIYNFIDRNELMKDVEGTAAEHNAEIQDNGDEIVAYTKDGEEVARWIIK